MDNIVKNFGGITVLTGVNFHVGAGEIVALLGDNGVGKLTLIKILTGVHHPTEGQIYFEGKPVTIRNPHEAHLLGIETVYQDLALVNRPQFLFGPGAGVGRWAVQVPGPQANE